MCGIVVVLNPTNISSLTATGVLEIAWPSTLSKLCRRGPDGQSIISVSHYNSHQLCHNHVTRILALQATPTEATRPQQKYADIEAQVATPTRRRRLTNKISCQGPSQQWTSKSTAWEYLVTPQGRAAAHPSSSEPEWGHPPFQR